MDSAVDADSFLSAVQFHLEMFETTIMYCCPSFPGEGAQEYLHTAGEVSEKH